MTHVRKGANMTTEESQPDAEALVTVSETQEPSPKRHVHHWERGEDPWHPDAYAGTPLWRYFAQPIPERAAGWFGCTRDGAIIDFVADGTPVNARASTFH
jgi:hypothetical protein